MHIIPNFLIEEDKNIVIDEKVIDKDFSKVRY